MKQTCSKREKILLHLGVVGDILGKYVLPNRAPRRAVNEEVGVLGVAALQFAQETPPPVVLERVLGILQHLARPFDGVPRKGVEVFGLLAPQRRLVVIAQDGYPETLGHVDARSGIGPVADNIAKADDLSNAPFVYIDENRLERLQVAVDIGNDRFQVFAPLIPALGRCCL